MNDDSDFQSIQDNRRLSSSFSQGGFFSGSPKDFNISKWIGDSKKLFGGMIMKNKQEQVEDFSDLFPPKTRPRTQSVSSDISVDEHPIERRASVSERYFALQAQQPKPDKFNTFRTAVSSCYYD